mmetsp:Transcript_14361/g.35020  ORF Transcript_14361/g.35020 Transcript_14361/m.35020 type:complete len:455 (+) Transcript_14361:65-1429(+)|eukprot:CAMPEP_0114512732 /NCGR_PEP_ID=MMETSP0109-20121206/15150_1 /TAXON_ID=29199 /ORGANISM="Chlorarachnion reptans, Strain CCCM449" /LENGTH=454 /DNA_ID=CAMNT_0001692471 /DNA_START=13 /DNA_END=1377 /DNA_ORIENTATION=+
MRRPRRIPNVAPATSSALPRSLRSLHLPPRALAPVFLLLVVLFSTIAYFFSATASVPLRHSGRPLSSRRPLSLPPAPSSLFSSSLESRSTPPDGPRGRVLLEPPSSQLFDGVADRLQSIVGRINSPLESKAKRVKLGDLSVSEMGIGTWAWGNQLLWGYNEEMDAELEEVFELCVSKGINLFDTGDSYGTGRLEAQSEKLLGEFLSSLSESQRGDINFATKLASYPWRLTPTQFLRAAQKSQERLQGGLKIGQLHWSVSNYAPWQEKALWDGLLLMKDEGIVKEVGVSNYGPKQLKKVYDYLKSKEVTLGSNQVQYSLLSRRDDIIEANNERGILTIGYSPLCLGLLTGRYNETHLPKSQVRRQLFKQLLPKAKPLLDELNAVATSRGKTMSQVAINWCMAKGCVPIPGAKTKAQAIENLGALGWTLSKGEVEALDTAASRSKVETVQNIFMTQ